MQGTLTPEQRGLVETAERSGRGLSSLTERPAAGVEPVDPDRDRVRWRQVQAVGWLGMRERDDDGVPYAPGLDVGLLLEVLGAHLVAVPVLGALLGAELVQAAGGQAPALVDEVGAGEVVVLPVLSPDLTGPVRPSDPSGVAVDVPAVHGTVAGPVPRLVPAVVQDGGRSVRLLDPGAGVVAETVDPYRACLRLPRADLDAADPVVLRLEPEAYLRWQAYAMAMVSCELVGVMAGALDRAVDHVGVREQYGRPLSANQAVRHACAEQHVRVSGARSIARYAAWAVDALPATEALLVARSAKAYCSSAAVTVTEAAAHLHGAMGMTWECDAHLFLRRAQLGRRLWGTEDEHYQRIADEELG